MKPHGRDCPGRCSMCRSDTVVRKVSQQAADLVVDGEVVRKVEADTSGSFYPRKRRR